jgi:acyl-CoA thioesterase-2
MPSKPASTTSVLDLVRVQPVGPGQFVGSPRSTARNSVFGGQLLGQTLSAAVQTAGRFGWVTSMQTYFISAPDASRALNYRVETRRDGGRYGWRNVLCSQDGRLVLESMVCLQDRVTPSPAWPLAADLPRPEALPSLEELAGKHGERFDLYRTRLGEEDAMDLRFVQGPPPLRTAVDDRRPLHQFWMRPSIPAGSTPLEMACGLAYVSDVNLLASPLLTIGRLGDGVTDFASSFDHSVRFYGEPARTPWLLYEQDTTAVAGNTLEARGVLMTDTGEIVLTASQQGIALMVPQSGQDQRALSTP